MYTYTYRVCQYTFPDDDNVEEKEVLRCEGLNFVEALDKLRIFAIMHPTGHLNEVAADGIEFESEDATVSAMIEME